MLFIWVIIWLWCKISCVWNNSGPVSSNLVESEEPHLAQPSSHAAQRLLKQHSSDHNAANLTFCVKEVASNRATWAVSIEIQDVRVAKSHQLEFPPFSDEEMHLVQLCLQACTDISRVPGGVRDRWGNTDDAGRVPALEQLTKLRGRDMHRQPESSPWLNFYVMHCVTPQRPQDVGQIPWCQCRHGWWWFGNSSSKW